jgi:hypothetical protein
MYISARMRLVETISGIRGGGDKGKMMEGVNSSMMYRIHCKNLCKCHNVPPPSTIIKNS